MPNWNQNYLRVTGDKEQLKDLKEKAKGKDADGNDVVLSFQSLVPMPEELKDTVSPIPENEEEKYAKLKDKYGAPNWYDWRRMNWGVKWDANWTQVHEDTDEVWDISFDTAWCPPVQLIGKLAEMYPKLRFVLEFREEGMAFEGRTEAENGEITKDESWEIGAERLSLL